MIEKKTYTSITIQSASATILLAIHLSTPSMVFCAEMADIYSATVRVAGERKEQRNEAINRALQRVLSKLLDSKARTTTFQIDNILSEATQFVQKYHYETLPSQTPQSTQDSRRLLFVSFDPVALNTAFEASGISPWGPHRPDILLWLDIEIDDARKIVSMDESSDLKVEIEKAAQNKGLPILFPLMDLTERRQLSPNEFSLNNDLIQQSSERYGVENVLAVRVARQTSRRWETRWKLFIRNKVKEWQENGSTVSKAFRAGMNQVFEHMFRIHAPSGQQASNEGVQIKISGIINRNDVQRAANHLKSLSDVRQVEWLSIEADSVIFHLKLNNDEGNLREILESGSMLEPLVPEAGAQSLHYRLLP